MARLVIVRPGQPDETHELSGALVTVGRKPENNIRIEDFSVSGRHAQFSESEGRYRLEDLNSTNKTYVNNVPIVGALLRGNCSVRFGNVECVFEESPIDASAREKATTRKLFAAAEEIKKLKTETDELKERLAVAEKELSTVRQQDQMLHENTKQMAEILNDTKTTLSNALNELETVKTEREVLKIKIQEMEKTAQDRNGSSDSRPVAPASRVPLVR